MKKQHLLLGVILSASLLFSSGAFTQVSGAVSDIAVGSSGQPGSTKDIAVGSSSQVEMIGTIEPTILSVTMPSYIPFNITNNITAPNKVVSPRITIKNNSNIPLEISVGYTNINISNLNGTTWSNDGNVSSNQIAIGLKQEEALNIMPQNLMNTKWLTDRSWDNLHIMVLDANQQGAMYVVGAMGSGVSQKGTFSVTPTLVVSRV